mmetsp:Transcript_7565/g.10855  ORF Transcript_7565/g.10855 Transcript_7565/m.10855 type:complete len:93 (+) Transcript_7565:280-558(+)
MEFQTFAKIQTIDFLDALPVQFITTDVFSPNAFTMRMIEHTLYHFGFKFRRKALSVYDMTKVPSNMATLRSRHIPPDSILADVGETMTINGL